MYLLWTMFKLSSLPYAFQFIFLTTDGAGVAAVSLLDAQTDPATIRHIIGSNVHYINWTNFRLVFIPLTGNSFIKSYKCKTGPASKFLINGRSKSCTCFEQCLSWAACHMTLICSLVIFPSTAKKLRSTWHCFMTSTCKFGPKINSTIFWVKIQPKSGKKPHSKYKLL